MDWIYGTHNLTNISLYGTRGGWDQFSYDCSIVKKIFRLVSPEWMSQMQNTPNLFKDNLMRF